MRDATTPILRIDVGVTLISAWGRANPCPDGMLPYDPIRRSPIAQVLVAQKNGACATGSVPALAVRIERRARSGETALLETKKEETMRLLLVILVLLLLVGALPTWPYSAEWGYYPSGGLGLVLIILIVLALMGFI